jgi:hypothetical protein
MATAIVAVSAWTVYGTIRQANDSNRLVLHTQEVLSQIEGVFGTVVAADSFTTNPASGADGSYRPV